jgi:hypothetical protein
MQRTRTVCMQRGPNRATYEFISEPADAAHEGDGVVLGFDLARDVNDLPLIRYMTAGIVSRASGRPPTEEERPFYHCSVAQLAHALLCARNLDRGYTPTANPGRVLELALTTSDFPLTLANIVDKVLLDRYANLRPTYTRLAIRRSFGSFRPHKFTRIGDFPVPTAVAEDGEVRRGSMSENAETITPTTYSAICPLSFQAITNDDLGAVSNLADAAAIRVADLCDTVLFAKCILPASGLGPTLSDAHPVFDAAHANLALSVTTLADARAKMLAQTSLDGMKLNTPTAYLLVPPASQTLAESVVAGLALGEESRIVVLTDANLTGTRSYVFGDPARGASNYVWGTVLDAGPRAVAQSGWATLGLDFRVSIDFGCGAVDYRYGATGAGA